MRGEGVVVIGGLWGLVVVAVRGGGGCGNIVFVESAFRW